MSESAPQVGSDLIAGRYEVREELGAGGLGVVFRVWDSSDGRECALKVLHGRDGEILAQLRSEFAILARLRHPGVVSVLDFGVCPARGPYFTMELVEGSNLGDVVADTPSDARVDLAAEVARQMLEVLTHVHSCGVVHADIKPSNVFAVDRRFKLGDFGLASEGRGAARGTVRYMAPEVLSGEAPHERSDLYSLGLTLLEVLTGKPAFARTDDRLRGSAEGLVEPATRSAGAGLRRLLRGLCVDDVHRRYRSAEEALADLEGGEAPDQRTEAKARQWELPLVGRAEEIETILESARSPQARILFVTGPSGVGKSRLLREVTWRLQVEGISVRSDSCRLGDPTRRWSQGRPRVRIVDDLQELTEGREPLQVELTRAGVEPGVLVLSGVRQGPCRELLAIWGQEEHVEEIRLQELGAEEVGEAVTLVLGGAAQAAELGRLIHEETSGNASQVSPALNGLVARGLLQRQAGRWLIAPLSVNVDEVRRAIQEGIGQGQPLRVLEEIGPEQRRLLEVISVWGGPPLELAVLEATVGDSGLDTIERLKTLQDLDLVQRDSTGGYSLRHQEIRSAVLKELSRTDVRRWANGLLEHGRALSRLHRFELLQLARRRDEAAASLGGVVDELIENRELVRAARLLRRTGSWKSPEGRRLLSRAGKLFRLAGEIDTAQKLFERLVEADAADFESRVELSECLETQGRFEAALELLEARSGTNVEEALRIDESRMWLLAMLGRYEASEELAASAIQRAQESGLDELEASLHAKLGSLSLMLSRNERAREEFERALAWHHRLPGENPRGRAAAESGLGWALRALGRPRDAVAHYEVAIRLFEEMGDLSSLARAEFHLANARYELGEWKRAEPLWRQSAMVAVQIRDRSLVASILNNLADMLKDQGRFDEADEVVSRALKAARGLPRIRAYALLSSGEIRAKQSRFREAERVYRKARPLVRATPDLVPALALRLAELSLAQGKTRAAMRRVTVALRLLRTQGRSAEVPPCLRLLAALHRIEGRPQEALELLSAALAEAESPAETLTTARLWAEMALCYRDLGQAGKVSEPAGQARETFERLGVEPDRLRLEQALATHQPQVGAPADVQMLMEVTRAVSSELSLDRLLETIVDKAIEISGAERGYLVLESPSEQGFAARAGRARERVSLPAEDFDVSTTVVRDVLRTGKTSAMVDLGADGGLPESESVHRLGLRTVLCSPIHTRERSVIGVVYVDSQQHRPFDDRVVSMMEALASQAGVAIVNAELFEDQRRKNELISVVSHELRGPLTSIRCYVELLRMPPSQVPDAKKTRFLELMDSECTRLSRLVENVLDLSRLEAGKASWSVAMVDMEAILTQVAGTAGPKAEQKGITVAVEIEPDLPPVLGNHDRITQVVVNLLDNAIKFTPQGGRIDLLAGPRTVTGTNLDFVEVRVKDTGPGIDPEMQEHIFEKFGQVGRQSKGSPGTGLGLTIAKEIVESHGGHMWVDSVKGEGSTFAFHLPLPAGKPRRG